MAQITQEDTGELKEIFEMLLHATKKTEIKNAIRILVERHGGTWRLVGDRENYPTVHMASSPASSAIERITNAIDAKLEAIALYAPKTVEDCESPRKLVEKIYKVKGGYLTSLEDMKGKRESLVKEAGINVTLGDGDTEATPTIDVLDRGIGVARDEFPETLLSLNKSNKIRKWYLMGRFGQGGSTTYRFSEYTVMVSRRRRASNKVDDDITFTIVKYQEAKKGEKDGQYVYLVRNDDKLPFSIPADGISFDGGTLVRHVNYELGRRYFLDVYGLVETYLFDPVLPFWLREERSWETNRGQGRRIFGSRDRLSRSDFVEEKDEFIVPLPKNSDLGSIILRYWVFKRGTQTKEKLTFIDPDEPIVVTYLGQTHAKLPRRILAYDCRLPNLYKDLVVQIDCDNITDKGRRVMFTSTREVLTEEGRRLLREALINTLSDELSELDQKRQLEFLTEGVTKAKDEMRRKLAEMINRIKPGTFKIPSGDSKLEGIRKKKRRGRRSKPPLPTRDFPTYVKIGNREDPLRFSEAWNTWIEIESDAPDDFLSKFDATLELLEETQKFAQIIVKHKDFKGGRLYMNVGLIGEPDIGTTFTFGIRMRVATQDGIREFTDTRKAIVVEPRQAGGEKKTPLNAPNIYEVWPDAPFWVDNEWTEENVAEVREGNNIDIYISFGNKWLVGAITRTTYTSTAQALMRNKYLLHMAFYAYLQHKGLKDLVKNGAGGEVSITGQNISQELLDKMRQESLEWAARAILTAITSERAFSKAEAAVDEAEVP